MDLNEDIILSRDVLALFPPEHPDRWRPLSNLGGLLSTRYKQLGRMGDLNEAIVLARDALVFFPSEYLLHRSQLLNNLADSLFARYEQLKAMEDLDEAIILERDALTLCPPGHQYLLRLADPFPPRYHEIKEMEVLDETIVLDRDALVLCPPGRPDRSTVLNNLADSLFTRYEQREEMKGLNQAVDFAPDTLIFLPPGHPDQSKSLENLAVLLFTRYKRLGGMGDLNEAIVLARDALVLSTSEHLLHRSRLLNNLADSLFARYEQLKAMEDLDQAVELNREALRLCPPGYPNRSASLENLTSCLRVRFIQLGQVEDREELFSLFAELEQVSQIASSDDLSAAKAWVKAAEYFHHPTTLLAYETALRLLVQYFAALPSLPQHLAILKPFASSLATDAFSACLCNHSPTNAVEFLEQGRVFWSQLTLLRSPLHDVYAFRLAGKTLAEEFKQLTSQIRNILSSPDPAPHDRARHLNVQLNKVVNDIRQLPGLSRFLLPPLFVNLQLAASGGPVIIVNASKYSCDALVVSLDQDPVHIPLHITKERVRQLSLNFRSLTIRAKRVNVTRDLAMLLRELWERVVSPIADFLRTTYLSQSRIWWCPAAEFALLPLHAAGSYRKGQPNLADLYISSYTPTLTALIRARRYDPSNHAGEKKRFVAIGENEPASIGTELATTIRRHVDGPATFTCIEGPESSISRVSEELKKNQWVHFACPGLQNHKESIESAFALDDGHLTLQRIIQCELQNPQFAYLSGCHTMSETRRT